MTRDTMDGSNVDSRRDFDKLFNAESVAIIGASTDYEKITGRPQYFLEKHGYDGDIYPINPKYDNIRGFECYNSVTELPDEVDVALILLSSDQVPGILKECGEKGIRYNLVIGSGFGESGEEGEELEAEILEIANEHDIRIIGPNTLGILGGDCNLTLSFSSMLDECDELLTDGELAIVSQSGSFAGMLFQITQRAGIGTKYWATTGNEIDIDALELMEFVVADPEVSMLVGFVESFPQGERLADVVEKARKQKTPIVFMKVGQSDRGQEAVSSHTGKMAGDYAVYESTFEEYGIVEVKDITTLTDVLKMGSMMNLEKFPHADDQWAVLTPSGGAGALIADAIDRENMKLSAIEADTIETLSEIVPDYGSVQNPVDTTANIISEYDLYKDAFTALLKDDNVDILLLQFGNTGPEQARAYENLITTKAQSTEKTVIAVFTGGKPNQELLERYEAAGVPTFSDPTRAVRTVRLLGRFGSAVGEDTLNPTNPQTNQSAGVSASIDVPADPGRWNWNHAAQVMEAYGISRASGRVVDMEESAVAVAKQIGFPVVLKASGPGLEHKTESGGIKLDISSPEEVVSAYLDIKEAVASYDPSIELDGILVQEHVEKGQEVIVGITQTDLGPVMMFGTGGTLVEVLDDVAYRTLPINRTKAQELLQDTAAGDILAGYRGGTYDTEALIDLMTNASRLYEEEDLTELDLNPIKVHEDGVTVVDFLAK